MASAESEIQAMVDRETEAWNRQDADALVALFHPDMVWPWPPDARAHDPDVVTRADKIRFERVVRPQGVESRGGYHQLHVAGGNEGLVGVVREQLPPGR